MLQLLYSASSGSITTKCFALIGRNRQSPITIAIQSTIASVIEPLYTFDVSLRHTINLYKQVRKDDACERTHGNVIRLLIIRKIIDNFWIYLSRIIKVCARDSKRSECRIEQRKKYRALSKEAFRD